MRRTVGLCCVAILAGCDGGPSDEEIIDAVEQAFREANPSGRTGHLMKGRTGVVWYATASFNPTCLEQNDLAFNDSQSTSRILISPTYQNQWGVTAATDTGYCIDLGADPAVSVGSVSPSGDGYRAIATITMGTSTKWFECLRSDLRERVVELSVTEDGAPVVETDMSLFQGDCPHPIPASAARTSGSEPTTAAPQAPSAEQIQQLAAEFDAALASRDGEAARSMVSCYNLFESPAYGQCALSEVIPHGSVEADEADPWLEYAARDFTVLSRATQDRDNPSMYHVPFTHRRTGATRSISVQWSEGRWKLVGVVSRKSPGLTVARILNDLHDRTKQDIFRRRVAGEEIDENGEALNPQSDESP